MVIEVYTSEMDIVRCTGRERVYWSDLVTYEMRDWLNNDQMYVERERVHWLYIDLNILQGRVGHWI